MSASDQIQEVGIGGERRADRRYSLYLDLRWRLIRRRKVLETGIGRTIDLSSGGILFDAGRHLPAGLNIELSITWPALLHNVAPMQLTVNGRIVRAVGERIALRIAQHEFRTSGAPINPSAMVSSEVPRMFVTASTASAFRKFH